MILRLQGKWEPARIATILYDYATKVDNGTEKWAKDCADRISDQIREAKCRSLTERQSV